MKSDEKSAKQDKVMLDNDIVRQMLALYRAVNVANESYTSGTTMYKLRADLITQTANARNVKTAFQNAAEAIGEEL